MGDLSKNFSRSEFERKCGDIVENIVDMFPNIDTFTSNRRLAIDLLITGIGLKKLNNFSEFIAAMNNNDFELASKKLNGLQWFCGVEQANIVRSLIKGG